MKKLTRVEIAKLMGVTPQAITKYQNGSTPKPANAIKLADILGVDVADVLKDTPGCIRKALEVDNS